MRSGPGTSTQGKESPTARIVLLVLLLAALALRVAELDRQDIWWDEARNIDVALRPLTQVAVAPELDIHPPLYFWLLHGWGRLTGLSQGMPPAQLAWLTRWLSVAAGVIGVALLARLAAQIGPRGSGVAAAALGTASAFWLAESQETRMYTVGFALLTAAAVAWLSTLPAQDPDQRDAAWLAPGTAGRTSWRLLAVFVICTAAALLTHYNAAFVIAAWYLVWGVAAAAAPARVKALRLVFLSGLATTALVAPVLPIALRQIPDYANPNLVVPAIGDYLAQNWRAYWAGYAFDPAWLSGWGKVWLGAALIIVGVSAIGLMVQRQGLRPTFVAAWLLLGLALYYVAVVDRGAFNVRYSSFVTPALYALAGAGLATAVNWRRVTVLALPVVVLLWPLALERDIYDETYAREDIAGVTAWLRAVSGPEDVILVDQKYPFGFYYQRYTVDAAASPVGPEAAPARYLFVDINTVDAQLNAWAGKARRVYWVQWFESDTDPRRAVPFLLDQAGVRGEKQWFRGYAVDTWDMTPPSRFTLHEGLVAYHVGFQPAVKTVEVATPKDAVLAGGAVPVVIRWQRVAGGSVERDLKARVALYDENGARVAQRDERLLNDRHVYPAEWRGDDQPLNVYLLTAPVESAGQVLAIGLLVYDAETLEPFSATDDAGNSIGIEAVLGHVQVLNESAVGAP